MADWAKRTDMPTLGKVSIGDDTYNVIAANTSTGSMGGGTTGGIGDYVRAIVILPAATGLGNVAIHDGTGSSMTIFTGGSAGVANLAPIHVGLGIRSISGAWKITTGTSVSAIVMGTFLP